ncbi:MAG: tetratricopeptide repeat protein [Verrucomicrobiaceae bacterium]
MSEKEDPQNNQAPSPIGEIEHGPSGLEAFLDANQKKLMVFGSLLIIAVVAYVIITGVQRKNRETAAAEISAANDLPSLRAAYEKHKDTPAGATALVTIAEKQWADQRQQEAIESLETALSEYPDHPLASSIQLRLGTYHRDLGNLEEATSYFQAAADADTAVSSPALVALGDLALRAGRNDEANAFYQKVGDQYGERHLNFRSLADSHKKLVGVAAPKEVTPAPKPEEAVSDPLKLPELPPLPPIPNSPKPIEPPTPDTSAED